MSKQDGGQVWTRLHSGVRGVFSLTRPRGRDGIVWATFTLENADLRVYRQEREKIMRRVCVSVLRTED